jgi:hypothetical protein
VEGGCKGEGGGAAKCGEMGGGGWRPRKGKKGGRPLGFCGRKKRRLRCLLTLHPTAHNTSPHPRTEYQLLVNIVFGILQARAPVWLWPWLAQLQAAVGHKLVVVPEPWRSSV